MKRYSNLTIGIAAGLTFLIIYNLSAFAYRCNEIRSDTIRLHIIASSDSDIDQNVKLKVRDAVLEAGQDIFDGTVNPDNAIEIIESKLKLLEETANNTLKENGLSYTAKATITTEFFNTRTYGDSITLPAGKYLALRIVLGEGEGKNWWCIMFPALCLPAVEKTNSEAMNESYSDEEKIIISSHEKYEFRFKVIEYIEKIKNYVDNSQIG